VNPVRLVTANDDRSPAEGAVDKKLGVFSRTIDALRASFPGSLRFNAFRSQVEFKGRPWTDAIARELTEHLQRKGLRCRVADVHEAAAREAEANSYDPLADSLTNLRWDGEERIDRWLVDYLGAEDSTYARAIGRAWIISAVARALQPGCKADGVLVLEGAQGVGKSSAIAILGGEFYRDDLSDLTSKDAKLELQGTWIVELAELNVVFRSAVEKLKAFISATDDSFRPPYGRVVQKFPRRCVFMASTNDDAYLRDSTGNRRFWPIGCGTIDVEALGRDRDQLLAEAVAAYEGGAPWWLSGLEVSLAAAEAAKRVESDPLEEPVMNYMTRQGANGATQREILNALGFDSTRVASATGGTWKRVVDVLRRNGFVRRQTGSARQWRYLPPGV